LGKKSHNEINNSIRKSYEGVKVMRNRIDPALEPNGIVTLRAAEIASKELHSMFKHDSHWNTADRRDGCSLWGELSKTHNRIMEDPKQVVKMDPDKADVMLVEHEKREKRYLEQLHEHDKVTAIWNNKDKIEADREAAATFFTYITMIVDQEGEITHKIIRNLFLVTMALMEGEITQDNFFRILHKMKQEFTHFSYELLELVDAAVSHLEIPLPDYEAWMHAHEMPTSWRVKKGGLLSRLCKHTFFMSCL